MRNALTKHWFVSFALRLEEASVLPMLAKNRVRTWGGFNERHTLSKINGLVKKHTVTTKPHP